jgi:hypothetical protein
MWGEPWAGLFFISGILLFRIGLKIYRDDEKDKK